jgi:two-component system sensor histidine kinase AgrC
MTEMILYAVLAVLEIVLYHQQKMRWILSAAAVVILGGILVWKMPASIILLTAVSYFVNHRHLIQEEKIYGFALLVLFGILFYEALTSQKMIFSLLAGIIDFVLEYVGLRIMKREENKTIIYQNQLMKQQVDEIENMYMTMRGWRHDYHNHLQSLKGYLKLGETEKMERYLKDLETDLDSIDTLYHSGNLQVDAILDAKLAIAEKDEIDIKCDASLPPSLHVNEIDLCVIIGNLLDNAIESCRKIDRKDHRFIRVYLGVLKQQLYISVTNATGESVKIRTDAYFSAKRGDHGHGLKRVDQVVEKYQGYLNRQNEPGVFATEILLPL